MRAATERRSANIREDGVVRISQGDIWWAELPDRTGLPKDSVANATQLVTIDKEYLTDRVGTLSQDDTAAVLYCIDVVLGR